MASLVNAHGILCAALIAVAFVAAFSIPGTFAMNRFLACLLTSFGIVILSEGKNLFRFYSPHATRHSSLPFSAPPRNSVTAFKNSAVCSCGGTCPHLSNVTSRAPAIPDAYRCPSSSGTN